MTALEDLRDQVRQFAHERDWEQFHNPKNLAMAMAAEAAEVLEIFQWLTAEQSSAIMTDPRTAEAVRHELADVLSYLLHLADVLEVDLGSALQEKLRINERRYPADKARGRSDKYDVLGNSDQ
ncbi:nucleotide pyrophosphohydrolase [Rugosimonospora acidiphila]|uniref:Nucleotide pyrophosphohydrolase n=1 Tax=Rugosimonospora acidiphila TaxID=556531 RepID=A0ABP9RJI9_9ACTN